MKHWLGKDVPEMEITDHQKRRNHRTLLLLILMALFFFAASIIKTWVVGP